MNNKRSTLGLFFFDIGEEKFFKLIFCRLVNDSNGDSKVEPNANGPPLANGVSNVSAPLENRSK